MCNVVKVTFLEFALCYIIITLNPVVESNLPKLRPFLNKYISCDSDERAKSWWAIWRGWDVTDRACKFRTNNVAS